MAAPRFCFIVDGTKVRTTREKELRRLAIREHSARMSHRDRKLRTLMDGFLEKELQISSPCTILGQGRVEPFGVSPAGQLPTYISAILDNAWVDVYSPLRPFKNGDTHPDLYHWRQASILHEAYCHAMISAATTVALMRNMYPALEPQIINARMYHTAIALRLLRQELSQSSATPSDMLIFVAIALCVHSAYKTDPGPAWHSRSPLVSAHRVDIFGQMVLSPIHAKALSTMFVQKGGYEAMTMPGMSELLCLTFILGSSMTGVPPTVPFLGTKELRHEQDDTAKARAELLGSGFGGEDHELLKVLRDVCKLTVALDHYQRAENKPPDLNDLIDFRTWVQYQLLLLPVQDPVHEPCRLAALIYSDLNVWPMPPSAGVRLRLVKQLSEAISDQEIRSERFLWVVAMGAIAAMDTDYEVLFSWLFTRNTRDLTWSNFRGTMLKFIWCDFVVAPLLEEIWQKSKAQKEQTKRRYHEFCHLRVN